jgi:predicted DNA-binding protein
MECIVTVSVRLDHRLEKELAVASERLGLSKSEIIKQSLQAFLREKQVHLTPYELGKDLFGKHGSGEGDRSSKEKIREVIKARVRAENNR